MEQEIEKLKQDIKSYQIDWFDDEFEYKDKEAHTMEVVKQAIDIEIEALKNGDYTKAIECKSIYDSAYSNFPEQDGPSWNDDTRGHIMEYIDEKLADTHKEIITKHTQEYANLPADITSEQLKSKISEFTDLCMLCNTQSSNGEKGKATEILGKIVNERISKLDLELQDAKAHIELPENETKCEELQKQIEDLEEEFGKAKIYAQAPVKINISTFNNLSEHKNARVTEQGEEMPDIMEMIERNNGAEFYVSRKTEYLEKKLAVLQQHKAIPGNADRINAIEAELEQMQDAWAIRNKRGIIINLNNQDIRKNTDRIEELQDELKRWERSTEPKKDEFINNIQTHISKLQSKIEMLQQDNDSIRENGTSKRIMGEHHRTRLEQEAKAKAEQEAKVKAEQEAKEKAEQEAKEKADQEAKAKAEQEDNLRVEPEIEVSNETQTIRREEEVYTISPEGLKKTETTIQYRNEQENDNRSDDAMKIVSALKRGITPDEYKKMVEILTQKEHQELYTEKYRPREESIRDEVGDELNRVEQNNNINNTQSVDLWMNRFNNWYNVIERMSQSVKAKFVKMKDDIVKAIKTITRDRSQSYEMEEHNDEQSER